MINKKNDHTSKCMIIIAAKSYDYSLRARLASVNALPAAKSSELTEKFSERTFTVYEPKTTDSLKRTHCGHTVKISVGAI